MLAKRQYSLRFLFLEVLLFALALAFIRQGLIWGEDGGTLCILAALFITGTALGGLFGSFTIGFALTFPGIFIGALALPAGMG